MRNHRLPPSPHRLIGRRREAGELPRRRRGLPPSNSNEGDLAAATELSAPQVGEFLDGLLWIGDSYKWIECRLRETLAKGGRARCFVHEAEWRGISRKVSAVPRWAVPRTTRIFLVHRGGATAPQHGKIFGYFVFERVEVLGAFAEPVAVSSPYETRGWSGPKGMGLLSVRVYESQGGRAVEGASVWAEGEPEPARVDAERQGERYCLELPTGRYRLTASHPGYHPAQGRGIEIPAGRRKQLDVYIAPDPPPPGERKERCWDGSEIVSHRWVDEGWQDTGERCPPRPRGRPKCSDGDLDWGRCRDGSLYLARVCVQGKWVPTGFGCPDPGEKVPIDAERFADHRSCSLRLRPSAIYIVDALCAEITDAFAADLGKTTIVDRYHRSNSEVERQQLVDEGRRRFREVVLGIHQRRRGPVGRIPEELAGKARLRGELVLFDQPATFVKSPRAAFRSLERIDGDHLLEQIADGVKRPTLRLYGQSGSGRSPTLSEVAARLAAREKVTLAAVLGLIDGLPEVVAGELRAGRDVGLFGLGTLRATRLTSQAAARRALGKKEILDRMMPHAGGLSRSAVKRLVDGLSVSAQEALTAGGAFRLPRIGTFHDHRGELRFRAARGLGDACAGFDPKSS